MNTSRRSFLQAAGAGGAGGGVAAAGAMSAATNGAEPKVAKHVTKAELDKILDQPVLKTDFLTKPVVVASCELLKNGKNYLLRTRSTDGVEAITVPNPSRMAQTYPLFLKNILPVFLKKDARTLEDLHWEVYRYDSNYKNQGVALWAGVAAMEMALL